MDWYIQARGTGRIVTQHAAFMARAARWRTPGAILFESSLPYDGSVESSRTQACAAIGPFAEYKALSAAMWLIHARDAA